MNRRFSDSSQLIDVSLVRDSDVPLQVQVFRALQVRILDGGLRPGARLPPSRTLARELGVSRNTIVAAYDQLLAEGYVEALTGSGTRVATNLPDAAPAILPERKRTPLPDGGRRRPAQQDLPDRVQDLVSRQRPGPRLMGPFEPGLPDLSLFPFDQWGRMTARFWRKPPSDLLLSGDIAGYGPLRQAIAGYLVSVRGLKCSADQVIITSGAQQGIDLTARVLLSEGEPVVLETPGYRGLRAAFGAAGASLNWAPVDGEGLDVAVAKQRVPRPRLVAVTPSHQFPLGVVMSLGRRLELLDWAAREGFWVLEDDYDSEYRYEGRPIAALQGLEARGVRNEALQAPGIRDQKLGAAERVIYAGSFSKVLFPALRLGFLVVPEALVDAYLRVRAAIDDHPTIAVQPVLAEFIERGLFASHLRRTRQVYGRRQDHLRRLIDRFMAGALTPTANTGGLHFCAMLKDADAGMDGDISARASDMGISAPAISAYQQTGEAPNPGLVLGFAGYDEAKITRAAETLAQVIA